MSAFVEIIFDNSDERFPTGKPEVTLRRTIGIKKDEYTLDRKNATKSDVMNLLESAGFSRSNPYYIVPQGRVTALTNMKDSERLTLLKEVAGTQVYEARRTESLKIMTETNNKRAKIDELLDYIRDRLNELEEEKEELKDFQEKDKERRCLQYTLDHREQVVIANELDNLDEQRQTGVGDSDDSRQRFLDGEETLASIQAEINTYRQQMELARLDKVQLESERRDVTKEKAGVELQLQSLHAGQAAAAEAKAQLEQELSAIRTEIQSREQGLAQVTPQFMELLTEETALRGELDTAETTRSRLYAKQGRNARFKSKKERDDWLRKEVNEIYPQLSKIKAVRMQTTENITELEAQITTMEESITNLRSQLDSRGSSTSNMKDQMANLKVEDTKLQDERSELRREQAKLDLTLGNSKKELSAAEQTLWKRMDQNTSRGLDAIRRYKKTHHVEGAYGTVAELLQIDKDTYRTAIEVTAGNSLFHYVVDNDETASQLMEMLQKERSGRITFMPLNRLKSRPTNVPKAADAVPLLEKIKYEPQYEKAFRQVFGKTIVCPNITIAAQYARSHGVSAITMEGDRSDKKGALTGGFHDKQQSRLDAVRAVTRWRGEVDSQTARLDGVRRSLETKDQEITQTVGNMKRLEQTMARQEGSYAPLRSELTRQQAALQSTQDALEAKQRALANTDTNMKVLTDQQAAHETEMASEFRKALTDAEEQQLQQLRPTVESLRRRVNDVSNRRGHLEAEKSTMEIELRENLRPRLEQLNAQEMETSDAGAAGNLTALQKELKRLDKALSRLENKLQEINVSLDHAAGAVQELEQRQAQTQTEQEEIARHIEKAQKRMERSMQRKALLTKQAAEVTSRIRELGVLPQEAFAKFEKMKSEAVVKRLRKVNDALKKYGHVNKKAFQQYEQFTVQRETLTKRRQELDSSQTSIEDLIGHLDQRKDEAIERTFKQVSKEFATVFETLVPAGRGRLIIQRRQDPRGEGDESADEDSVENYIGVGIAVSFNSKHDDQQRIQQLSGGQKSEWSEFPVLNT